MLDKFLRGWYNIIFGRARPCSARKNQKPFELITLKRFPRGCGFYDTIKTARKLACQCFGVRLQEGFRFPFELACRSVRSDTSPYGLVCFRHFLTTPIGGVFDRFEILYTDNFLSFLVGLNHHLRPCDVFSVKLSTHIDNARATRLGLSKVVSQPTAIRPFAPV